MKLNGNAEAVYAKIAKLRIEEVPIEHIAMAVGGTVEEIEQIVELEDYKKVFGGIFTDIIEGDQTRNSGWDEVESKALLKVFDTLDDQFVDPDFALKAAALANKAHRRHVGNKPITAGNGPMVTVFQLNATYVDKLAKFNMGDRPPREVEQNKQSFMDVEQVQDVLGFSPGVQAKPLVSQEREKQKV